jgi:hypothetical protein
MALVVIADVLVNVGCKRDHGPSVRASLVFAGYE